MTPIVEAAQILQIDERLLFQRAHGWYYGAAGNSEAAAKRLHDKFKETRVYPPCVLAFVAAVRRNGRVA